jgi:hypothetical protein
MPPEDIVAVEKASKQLALINIRTHVPYIKNSKIVAQLISDIVRE